MIVVIIMSVLLFSSIIQNVNANVSSYGPFGWQLIPNIKENLKLIVANDTKNEINQTTLSNITQTLNNSNITISSNNISNNSGAFNTTIPEQVSPKALNGSTPARI
ncbi:MAG TPA: hypothetical protein VJ772_01900 [Nitrososphaeraceae archaeon]|nr:hypothetical protein [Nitrososphaeraceae archaeon]